MTPVVMKMFACPRCTGPLCTGSKDSLFQGADTGERQLLGLNCLNLVRWELLVVCAPVVSPPCPACRLDAFLSFQTRKLSSTVFPRESRARTQISFPIARHFLWFFVSVRRTIPWCKHSLLINWHFSRINSVAIACPVNDDHFEQNNKNLETMYIHQSQTTSNGRSDVDRVLSMMNGVNRYLFSYQDRAI